MSIDHNTDRYSNPDQCHICFVDDDLDNAGCEYLMDLWEKALDIEYGRDYGYVQGPRGEAVLCGMGVSPL